MRMHPSTLSRTCRRIAFVLVFVAVGALVAEIQGAGGLRLVPQTPATLQATIFSYDGHEFVRTNSTLRTEAGKSAVNTKLDHDTPAYRALVQKHSYTGDATVFGKRYDARYAPLTDSSGRVTGALFVAVPE